MVTQVMTKIVFWSKIQLLATNVCGIPYAYWSYQTIALKPSLRIDPCKPPQLCLHLPLPTPTHPHPQMLLN